MKKLFEHKILLFFILATIGVAIFIGVFSVKRNKATLVEDGVSTAMMPMQKGVSSIGNWFSGLFGGGDLQAENERLQKEKQDLEKKINEMQGLADENEELREMLDLKKQEKDFTLEAAQIIAKDPSNWYGTFTIDKGTSSGIQVNQPVVSANRELIGKIYRVGTTWAEVITIYDTENSVGSTIKRCKAMGVVEGDANLRQSGTCRMNYIARDADIREGDFVESSGLGGVYPAGILIGKITSVGEDASTMSKYAVVQPSANIEKIGEIFVITNSETFVAKDGEEAKRQPTERKDDEDETDTEDKSSDKGKNSEEDDESEPTAKPTAKRSDDEEDSSNRREEDENSSSGSREGNSRSSRQDDEEEE